MSLWKYVAGLFALPSVILGTLGLAAVVFGGVHVSEILDPYLLQHLLVPLTLLVVGYGLFLRLLMWRRPRFEIGKDGVPKQPVFDGAMIASLVWLAFIALMAIRHFGAFQ